MTYDNVKNDMQKFVTYLRANGKRPVAILVEVCDDTDNSGYVISLGNNDVVIDACLTAIASRRGMEMTYK
jgi:hypothetical protein